MKSPSLRRLRTASSLTIRQLAQVSGVGTATISRLESGSDGTPTTNQRLAKALGCKPVDLAVSTADEDQDSIGWRLVRHLRWPGIADYPELRVSGERGLLPRPGGLPEHYLRVTVRDVANGGIVWLRRYGPYRSVMEREQAEKAVGEKIMRLLEAL